MRACHPSTAIPRHRGCSKPRQSGRRYSSDCSSIRLGSDDPPRLRTPRQGPRDRSTVQAPPCHPPSHSTRCKSHRPPRASARSWGRRRDCCS
eukprot:417959-Prymnesium_polylepis.1